MFTAALFTIAKTWNQPKCPSMVDWTGKMWHIYTMEYYPAIKNDEFMSFVGTWMNLENISQQTERRTQNEIPHILTHRQVRKNENTQTQGREYYTMGSIGGNRGGTARGGAGEGQPGEKCQMWVKEMKAEKHTAMCLPMQLSCMFCTCTPKPKMQLKKK